MFGVLNPTTKLREALEEANKLLADCVILQDGSPIVPLRGDLLNIRIWVFPKPAHNTCTVMVSVFIYRGVKSTELEGIPVVLLSPNEPYGKREGIFGSNAAVLFTDVSLHRHARIEIMFERIPVAIWSDL